MSMDFPEPKKRDSPGADGMSSKPPVALIVGIVVAVAAIVFIAQNTAKTKVQFGFIDATLSLWVVIVIAMVLGALLGFFVPKALARRKAKQAKQPERPKPSV